MVGLRMMLDKSDNPSGRYDTGSKKKTLSARWPVPENQAYEGCSLLHSLHQIYCVQNCEPSVFRCGGRVLAESVSAERDVAVKHKGYGGTRSWQKPYCNAWIRGGAWLLCVRQLPNPLRNPVQSFRLQGRTVGIISRRFHRTGVSALWPSLARCGGWQGGRLGGTPKELGAVFGLCGDVFDHVQPAPLL